MTEDIIYDKTKLSVLKKIFQFREAPIIIVIIVFMISMYFSTPLFYTFENLKSIGISVAMETPVVIGMSILLISGSFDLSVGAVSALSGMVAGILMANNHSVFFSIIMGITSGVLIGVLNGLMVTNLKINTLIATLATMTIGNGLTFLISMGKTQTGFPQSFAFLGQAKILGIYFSMWLALIMVLMANFSIKNVRVFKQVYFVGADENSAMLQGININRVKMVTLILSSFLASLTGIIMSSRVLAASPVLNDKLALRVITAAVIGGCTLSGGEGSIIGAFFGLVLMFLIYNAMVLLGVSVYWQGIVVGVILIVAVVTDSITKKRKTFI